MTHCQNCGKDSHCGVPQQSYTFLHHYLRICKKCRCEKCLVEIHGLLLHVIPSVPKVLSDSSYIQETYEENNKTPFMFHDQNDWDWK